MIKPPTLFTTLYYIVCFFNSIPKKNGTTLSVKLLLLSNYFVLTFRWTLNDFISIHGRRYSCIWDTKESDDYKASERINGESGRREEFKGYGRSGGGDRRLFNEILSEILFL